MDKLAQLREDFDTYKAEQNARWDKLLDAQERNTDAIKTLSNDTRDVVRLYKDWQSTTRIGVGLQNGMMWVVKWGAVAAAISYAATYAVTHA